MVCLCIPRYYYYLFIYPSILYVIYWIYTKITRKSCKSKASLNGKTVIITGANTGIGLATAIDLARRDARVIIACRNLDKGKIAVQTIRNESGNDQVILKELDLSSLKSVRKFAETILKEEPYLHILINNAGAMGLPSTKTEDGLEINMATNHFGHFLLTNLLMDLLKKSAPSRILNVSSIMHKFGEIDFENLDKENQARSPMQLYSNTKLANILFTRELSRILEGTGVTANCLTPGGPVDTEICRYLQFPWNVLRYLHRIIAKSANSGAQTTIHCAVSEEVEGVSGKYFNNCNTSQEGTSAQDDGAAKKLWEISERLSGLN